MKDVLPEAEIVERLRAAVESDALPQAARRHARQLHERLSAPVRVTLLGLPRSGKSELLNMFVGREVVPTDRRLPSMEIRHGDAEEILQTKPDGDRKVIPGLDFGAVDGDAAFLQVSLEAPILKTVSLLEVVTDGSKGELEAAIDWAVRRTDIALWCSQEFGPLERAAWSRVPDTLKDHAFIVLTKADLLSAEHGLAAIVNELEIVVSEEFHSLFAVATRQALRAMRPDGSVDEALRHASGGEALTAEILRHAERGRRADMDTADLFLARYQVGAPAGAGRAASQPRPPDSAAPPPPGPQTKPSPRPERTAAALNRPLMEDATAFLMRRAEGLERTAAGGAESAPRIVAQCVDAVEHLVDHFSQDDTGCAAADRMIDDLTEASDLITLMQSEEGEGPAADAVTLLLQLKRGMEDALAA